MWLGNTFLYCLVCAEHVHLRLCVESVSQCFFLTINQRTVLSISVMSFLPSEQADIYYTNKAIMLVELYYLVISINSIRNYV
jgi:hypothetical protein